MNKMYPHDGTLKKWLRKVRSPVSSFYRINMKPEIIYQEMMQSGKPVAWYEKLLTQAFLIIFLVLGLLGAMGVHWNIWVSGIGLIMIIPFLIIETILYRLRSFSRDVKQARLIILFFMMIVTLYFAYLL